MKLSIVTTLYHSAAYINSFYCRASAAARQLVSDEFEVIFVNDGSPDDSLELAIKIAENDPKVILVDLSRNFGHHKALMTGLAHSNGDRVFLIDSDLEEEPEWLLSFTFLMDDKQCDVVYGVQSKRKGSWFERLSGHCFYQLFKFLTDFDISENITTARLMTRRYVDALLQHREREIFMAGLWHITGFDQRYQVVKKNSISDTTYTFQKKLSLLVNSVTSFSNIPLISIFYIGISISTFTLIYIVYLFTNWLFLAKPLSGWTSVMASIWLIGGMVIAFIGILGIYLSKIFSETKQRPYTIVKKIYAQRNI
jgi:putative glycosyltransferase